MEKLCYQILLISPLLVNWLVKGQRSQIKIIIFAIITALQITSFLLLKAPNCYDIVCPAIENNGERQLFYEKYNTLNDDLNLLRSEQYQQNILYQALHYQLIFFLILLALSNEEKYEKTMNAILYIVLLVFSTEASLLLTNELYKIPYVNLTYFEIILLLKLIEISMLLLAREISASFQVTNIFLLEEQLAKLNQVATTEDNPQVSNIKKALEQLKVRPKSNFFSIETTYNVIALAGIIQLFSS